MRKLFLAALATLIAALVITGADWPTQSGSPQRDAWARAEKAFTRENAGKIELLYKYKAENQARGLQALTSPLVNGMLITYLGFKEMLVFGGSSDNVYAVDADLNRIIWKTHFEYKGDKPQTEPTGACPGGLTASLAMPGSSSAAGGRGFGGPPGRGGGRSGLFATGFGRSGVFIAVGGDGSLHALNTSTGADKIPPVKFLPPNSKTGALNVNEGVIYASTMDNCGGNANAIYALDMSGDASKLSSFPADAGGTAIGTDGTVYAQTKDGVLALSKDLQSKDSFTPSGAMSTALTPLVFQWKGKDILVAGGSSGRLYLLDSASLGGPNHHTPLYQTEAAAGSAFQGAFSSWEETPGGPRWIYASSTKGIMAFKVEDRNGGPQLTSAWTSADIAAPVSLVTANGLLFALTGGKAPAGHATLHVLDGLTGKELYSYAAATFTHDAGLAVANRRIYFTDHSNTVYCLGFMADQPQLTGR